MTPKNNSNELRLFRIYDAPVTAVWEAWTDPEQVAQWWGPRGFTLTTHSKDLRPGGHWSYTMHGPDGTDFENKTLYFEVEENAKLVYDHGGNDDRPPLFRVTVLFKEVDGKTHMDMTMAFPSPEVAKEMAEFIRKAGGNSTWDRLAEYVEKQSSGKEKFVINRSFAAPIETLYEVWTQPEHIKQWMSPTGTSMEYLRADLRVNGSCHYKMKGPQFEMFGRAEYLELTPPRRVVYTQQFCDESEKVTRHPMAPTWPETMLTTVEFTAEGPDQTRVTITWEVYGEATPEEIAAFVKEKPGMTQGWTGSLDKLEDYLEKK